MDGMLLQSVEALELPFVANGCEIWEALQAKRQEIGDELLADGRLCEADTVGLLESEASEEYARAIRWRRREMLEGNLRDISEAQDRLMDGLYGRCIECGEQIDEKRLAADPAASRCIRCQRSIEQDQAFQKIFAVQPIQ